VEKQLLKKLHLGRNKSETFCQVKLKLLGY